MAPVVALPTPDPYARRRGLVEAFLRERSVKLADLYAWAGALLEDRRPEGWPHMVAHVGRELMNRLADHLDEVPVGDPDARTSPTRPEEIARRLSKALKRDEGALRTTARELVEAIEDGGRVTELRAAALVAQAEAGEQLDQADIEAWVRAWRELQRRFARRAHLPGPTIEVPEGEVECAWRELTDLLATRVALEPFFESMDDLLELAGRADPDQNTVQAALARLRRGTKSRFYEELVDPRWVELLAAEGMFRHPPAAIRQEDTIRFPEWPEGLVLLRFAATAPELVAAAAVGVPASDNARVAQLLAATAAELPAEVAADTGLAGRVARDLSGTAQLLDVAEPAGQLAQRLARAGRLSKALEILKALLRIEFFTVSSGSDIFPDWQRARYRHDEYLVDRSARAMLDDVVAADACKTIKTLTRLLAGAQRKLDRQDSTRWRDDVSGAHSPFGDDPRHLLLELLRDACAALAMRGGDQADWVLEHLQAQESAIFKRLWVHLLAELPNQSSEGRAALMDPDTLFSRERLGEAYRLLPVGFAEMDAEDRAALLALINAGPAPASLKLPAEEFDTDFVSAWQDEWRQRLLSALEPLLETDDRARLDDLRARRGRIDHPGFVGMRSTSWVGPTSPASAVDLAAMEREDLVALMLDFRAERHFGVPSPEGLGRELARAVESDPTSWSWLADRLGEIPPVYVRSWLNGLTAAVRADARLPDAERVLAAIAWVLEQPADADAQRVSLDEDTDFYGSQHAGADLLVEALRRDQLQLGQREQAWTLVHRLAADPDPTPDREASADAEPAHLALSALRARGAEAVLRYLWWLDARLPNGAGPGALGFAAAPETQPVLERLLDEDDSRAVRAALAVELAVLVTLDRDWLAARIGVIADPASDALARVGWSAYLKYAALYAPVITLLADAYRRAVASLGDAPAEIDEDRRHLADHVAVIWRDIPDAAPGLLDELLAVAPDADCARGIATLGRALHREGVSNYEPTDADLTRHRALWDARLDDQPGPLELREFGWWWSSGRLRDADDLRRLAATLRMANGRVGDVRTALKVVDEILATDPALTEPALEVLEALADARTAQSQYIDPALLTRLLSTSLADPAHRARATAVVHRFGEQGYLTLRSLLDGPQ
jgi:hypothetical protein